MSSGAAGSRNSWRAVAFLYASAANPQMIVACGSLAPPTQ
jgi:hypothetical protein